MDKNPFWEPNNGYLGDYVETTDAKPRRGRIYDAHFYCPEPDTWLAGQELLGPDPMSFKRDRWVSILHHGGGAIVVPESFVRVIEPFELHNNSSGMYWPLTPEQYAQRPGAEPGGERTTADQLIPGRHVEVWGFLDPEHYDGRFIAGVVAEHGRPSGNAGRFNYAVKFTDGRTVYCMPHAVAHQKEGSP